MCPEQVVSLKGQLADAQQNAASAESASQRASSDLRDENAALHEQMRALQGGLPELAAERDAAVSRAKAVEAGLAATEQRASTAEAGSAAAEQKASKAEARAAAAVQRASAAEAATAEAERRAAEAEEAAESAQQAADEAVHAETQHAAELQQRLAQVNAEKCTEFMSCSDASMMS